MRVFPEPLQNKVHDSMKHWIPILRTVLADDQKHRIPGMFTISKIQRDEQARLDSQNLKIVTGYLDRHGWPVRNDVGFIGQKAIGICIQHAAKNLQEKYYPLLVRTFKRDSTLVETLALLEDRINVRNNRYQNYGTQIIMYKGKKTLYPVRDVDSIERIRKKIGAKVTLESYLKLMQVDWDVREYKEMLPDMVRDLKVSDTPGLKYRHVQ